MGECQGEDIRTAASVTSVSSTIGIPLSRAAACFAELKPLAPLHTRCVTLGRVLGCWVHGVWHLVVHGVGVVNPLVAAEVAMGSFQVFEAMFCGVWGLRDRQLKRA